MKKNLQDTVLQIRRSTVEQFDTVKAPDIFVRQTNEIDSLFLKKLDTNQDLTSYYYWLKPEFDNINTLLKLQKTYPVSKLKNEFENGIDVTSYYYSKKDSFSVQKYQKDKAFEKIIYKNTNKVENKPAEINFVPEIKIQIHEKETKYKAQSDVVLLSILLGVIIFAYVKTIKSDYIKNIFICAVNKHFAGVFYREHKNSPGLLSYLLRFNFYLSCSVFIYMISTILKIELPVNFLITIFGIIFPSILIIRLLYKSLKKIISLTYNAAKESEEYIFNTSIHRQITGLLLIPVNLFITYTNESIAIFSVFTGVLIVVLMKIFDILRLSNFFFNAQISGLYLFLYLCSVEIIPALAGFRFLGEHFIKNF